jgi:hypothetical protein
VSVSKLAEMIVHVHFIKSVLDFLGLASIVDGLLATIGLTIMMSFLPMFLGMIFTGFFELRAARWGQLQMQSYYYWFLVLFVLLTTAIGTNLVAFIDSFAKSPFMVFKVLAQTMPNTTHFYLKYVLMQPTTHGMELTRWFYVLKYWLFTQMVDSGRARELGEPEDQDYYGVGGRCARQTLMLMIGLVFGLMCPLMHCVVLLNFLMCRLVFGYLIPYQECRKIDMGGENWAMEMDHVHKSLIIFMVTMTGILFQRAESIGPGIISAISFIWWFMAYRKFNHNLHWERIPYRNVVELQEEGGKTAIGDNYKQFMLEPPTSEFVQFPSV